MEWFIPDPFADAAKGDDEGVQDGLVHIRIQQRNGRKTLTTVQGLSKEYDLKRIVRACKKVQIKLSIARFILSMDSQKCLAPPIPFVFSALQHMGRLKF